MSEPCGATAVSESAKMCEDFVHKYYHVFNTRPDLLYRLYSPNSRMSVSETVRGKNKNISASASNQHEIRYLLTCILDRIHAKLISLSFQRAASDQLLLMVNGLFKHEVSQLDHFFTQTFMLVVDKSRLAISTDVLQIHSHNIERHLLTALQSNIKDSKHQIGITYPPVVDTMIRSKVGVTTEEELSEEVGSLFVAPTETLPLSTETDTMKGEDSETPAHRRIEPDTAREVGSTLSRTQGWDTFSKDKPGLQSLDVLELQASEDNDANFDTPRTSKLEKQTKHTGLFLNCFGDVKKGQEDIKTEVSYQWSAPSKMKSENSGAYLRLFGFQPIPDGPPVEWDLSQDAVLTQLKTYQDVADRFRMPVPKRRTRSMHSNLEWYHRTVYLDNLPLEVHPESLRRAFETMFGEIEEENGIIIASATKSSIAYVVFKSLESAKAVGLSDTWIKGSKIIIQKYKPPFPHLDSNDC